MNGDDEYRNRRLKIIPVVAEGPLAVKVLAPPRRELVVRCEALPVTWRNYEASRDPNGRELFPAIECEIDCMSNRAIRAMAGILKRNLGSLCIDIACIIQKPDGLEEDEPQACLGLFRFNHIDVERCPAFPDRFAADVLVSPKSTTSGRRVSFFDPDVSRASMIMKIDPEELEKLAEEEEEG